MSKILIVDDESWLREMIRLALEQQGFEVIEATDSTEGVTLAREHLPDLILCDVNMDKQGAGYFTSSATPAAASGAEIRQGKLEASNVTPAEGAMRLVTVMRQFEMLQKAISVGTDMNRKAIEEVARVGS